LLSVVDFDIQGPDCLGSTLMVCDVAASLKPLASRVARNAHDSSPASLKARRRPPDHRHKHHTELLGERKEPNTTLLARSVHAWRSVGTRRRGGGGDRLGLTEYNLSTAALTFSSLPAFFAASSSFAASTAACCASLSASSCASFSAANCSWAPRSSLRVSVAVI